MRRLIMVMIALCLMAMGVSLAEAASVDVDPCLSCHDTVTPGIIKQWKESKHSKVGVKCYVCHKAKEEDPSGYTHNGFQITAVPSPKYCESCHPKEVAENSRSKHAWGAFMGPLKPYYAKAKKMGLDPLSQETAKNSILKRWQKGH